MKTFVKTTKKWTDEIDLHRLSDEQAIVTIDKFIDHSVLHRIHRINLIHGKGTGALRNNISEYLKKHLSVKSFRFAEENKGGHGVKVANLK